MRKVQIHQLMKIQVCDKFFTAIKINQGYENSCLMKTINCDEHSKLH